MWPKNGIAFRFHSPDGSNHLQLHPNLSNSLSRMQECEQTTDRQTDHAAENMQHQAESLALEYFAY